MKKITTLILLLLATAHLQAQKFYTKSATINFSSKAPLEDIDAVNRSASAVIDTKTGAIQFAVIIRGFEFQKALMQEHFNENFMESHKFPKSEFKGQILNNSSINYTKPGSYQAIVKGLLTIHGVTRNIQTGGTIKVEGEGLRVSASFPVTVADYKIRVPSVVRDKVAKTVSVRIDAFLDPLAK